MKKSSFVSMIMGTIGGAFFGIGMCMCLLPEWELYQQGVIMSAIGAVVLLATLIVWRVMTGKDPARMCGKTFGALILGVIGALALGVGMCFAMVWSNIILGIIIGLVGIVMLLSLIPIIKGFKQPIAAEVHYE